ncbi:MAG: aldehyde dehydrogenase family protein [Zoogloea sp.]|nr:aldehyde dehydrogenase family protein [Zoogloea sp.]
MKHLVDERLGEAARSFLARPKRLLIGGGWCEAASGETLTVIDPATARAFAEVQAGGAEDVARAVAAARLAFESGDWPKMRPVDRERLLLRLADLVEANAQELAEIESLDNGKPLRMARAVDVKLAVDFLRYMAGWATKLEGSTLEVSAPLMRKREFFGYTRKQPVGVVGAIIPWNFPLLMAVWKIGPALACGCTVVLKPAEETPLSALRLGELLVEAGSPPGVVNIVTGEGHVAGAALAANPGVDKIAFTGSTEVGRRVGKAALDNMTRVSLELGGKSPVIVLADADPAVVAAGAAQAIFYNQGQVCTAGSRLYVHRSRFDAVLAGVVEAAGRMRIGHGLDGQTDIGPLVSEAQFRRVCGYVESGLAQGARLAAGGRSVGEAGYFVQPTVLVDVRDEMRVVQEEIFGPVLVAMPFDDLDEVVVRANGTPYGLAASIWSNDLAAVHRLVPRIRAGTVWVNCHNILDNALPFGGFKQSGIGREMGRDMLDLYTETQSVLMAL